MSNKPKRTRRTKEQIEADKAQKQTKATEQPKGLGDVVETITKATGVKAFVEFMNGGEPCGGCEKRKEALNKLTFRRKPQPLTEEDVIFIDSIKDKNTLKATEVVTLYKTHARLFNEKYTIAGNCSSCVGKRYNDLQTLLKAYQDEKGNQ